MATMRKYYAAFTPQKTPKPTTLNPIFCDLNFLLLLKHFKGFIFSSVFFEFPRFNITDMFYITSRTIRIEMFAPISKYVELSPGIFLLCQTLLDYLNTK